jgi:hypothetical protein
MAGPSALIGFGIVRPRAPEGGSLRYRLEVCREKGNPDSGRPALTAQCNMSLMSTPSIGTAGRRTRAETSAVTSRRAPLGVMITLLPV